MTKQGWIAVGVDGSDGSMAAAQWAAREARRVGAGLRLVHVFSANVPMAGVYAAVFPHGSVEGRKLAERMLRKAAQAVQPILDGDRVEQVVLRGDRRAGLLRAAADADLMVLGDVPHPAHHRVITGSITGPVAAHSPTPVVVVPTGCEVDVGRGVVVAGVKFFASSRDLIRQAFEVAAGRAARLVLVHAWDYSPYEGLMIDRVDLNEWEARSAKELGQVVDEVSRDFPAVEAEVRFDQGQPARVLAEASAEADLLAITRRLQGLPFGHLGATGRAVLREVRCPAVVLPPAVEHVAAEADPTA